MKRFLIDVSENGLAFAKELVASKLAVTIDNIEIVAEFKRAVLSAKPIADKETTDEHASNA